MYSARSMSWRSWAKSAGAEVLGRMTQRKDRPDPATLMVQDAWKSWRILMRSSEAELVIFDHELGAGSAEEH